MYFAYLSICGLINFVELVLKNFMVILIDVVNM